MDENKVIVSTEMKQVLVNLRNLEEIYVIMSGVTEDASLSSVMKRHLMTRFWFIIRKSLQRKRQRRLQKIVIM